jgi:NAD(P)-dependent dehydrogenase (short-subunit alcohol dehydrogenase family)
MKLPSSSPLDFFLPLTVPDGTDHATQFFNSKGYAMQIRHQTALVTGANRGIGKALVQSLLTAGANKVYATSRNLSALEPLVALDPTRVVALKLDVTNFEEIKSAAERAADVTLLFNNAGVLDFGSVLEAPGDAFRRNLDVNFYGLLHVTRVFAPLLKQNGGGAVTNVLTLVALASMPGLGVYNASKAAAWSVTQSLRADLGKQGTKVFNVFPGAIDTDMLRVVEMPKTAPEYVAKEVLAGIEADHEDIFPDPMSQQLYGEWKADHKAVERQFAAM